MKIIKYPRKKYIDPLPPGWIQVNPHSVEDVNRNVLVKYQVPMEGWDNNNHDIVTIYQDQINKLYYVNVYIAFGEGNEEGPFDTLQDSLDAALGIMEDISREFKTAL